MNKKFSAQVDSIQLALNAFQQTREFFVRHPETWKYALAWFHLYLSGHTEELSAELALVTKLSAVTLEATLTESEMAVSLSQHRALTTELAAVTTEREEVLQTLKRVEAEHVDQVNSLRHTCVAAETEAANLRAEIAALKERFLPSSTSTPQKTPVLPNLVEFQAGIGEAMRTLSSIGQQLDLSMLEEEERLG